MFSPRSRCALLLLLLAVTAPLWAQGAEPVFPPVLAGGEAVVVDTSEKFLVRAPSIREGVVMAKQAPRVTFAYFPEQDYAGKPWSNWGDSLAVGGKYYASIGDHLAPAGNARVFEFDPATSKFRKLLDLAEILPVSEGKYRPGKIHSRIDLGSDGWLYMSTHRGSTKVTADQFGYVGDYIVRCHPERGQGEVVAIGAVPKHCVPTSVLDPKRLIFYGGTAPGTDAPSQAIQFFAYDCANQKLLYAGENGPPRYIAYAASTGRIYFTTGNSDTSDLMRFDPATDKAPVKLAAQIGMRAATMETPDGLIYTVSSGQKGSDAMIYALDTKTETVREIGPAAVGGEAYIASLDVDPTGRYLYYVPGAHGGSDRDGGAVVQLDTKTKTRKVLCSLAPHYQEKYGFTLKGTYSTAIDATGERLYVNWNISRGSKAWDCCGLTMIEIPASERP
ncbi:hypothetical protein Psta_1246 [Pirellula staleyi DSM 6068]|uniref:Uncharacterized protein n=1 Tax=Pirellula staleyi (strain ATCC 27377 / DSM 6068 / ICPB 4128) TaxID=530564 RepID=D2QW49_PIRSD|nr:hypothetical protein [Pirellula staleyi]ADB15924.1 hypothetical protein Psta_1246 [Pirellula staleyi DSM 6068]